MDVKAVNSTSAALQMQSQNVEREKVVAQQTDKESKEQDKTQPFKNLDKNV